MNDLKGSIWRKWDLHVHTPYSIVHGYSCNNGEDQWEKFITELEALPEEIKVIGINDYLFIDGYRKVLEEKNINKRLQNIGLFLPVIEFRLDKFGGSKSHLSRVNFHVIFSNEISPDIIQQQFLNALPNKYNLSPQYNNLKSKWSALATKESLFELGQLIINSVPEDKRDQFGSPFLEGFNNLNFKLEDIQKALESHYFEGKVLTAVGKTEWADIKWNDHTIADKKDIINSTDLVFISAESVEDCIKSKEHLKNSNVNDLLLDCSDAHYYSNSSNKDRLGKCYTWIKTDTTFEGLKQVLNEPESRIFHGDKPEKLIKIENNKTKYICGIQINKDDKSSLNEKWFDNKLEFNPDLIAIIGNKGSGKSALADIIGLLGCSHSNPFSFLNNSKFRNPKDNKSRHFEAVISWYSGENFKKNLSDVILGHEVERVKYIPQQFLEKICNEIENSRESQFDKELKKVIFSHVEESSRLGQISLDELLSYKTQETNETIVILKNELNTINENLVDLEQRISEENFKLINEKLKIKQQELKNHEDGKPEEVKKPESDKDIQELAKLMQEIEKLHQEKEKLTGEISTQKDLQKTKSLHISAIDKLLTKFENLIRHFEAFKQDCLEEIQLLKIDLDQIVNLNINKNAIITLKETIVKAKDEIDKNLDEKNHNSLVSKRSALDKQINELQSKLDEPNKKYQQYLKEFEAWNEKKQLIIGDKEKIDSIEFYKQILNDIKDEIPKTILELKEKRLNKTREIYQEIKKVVNIYKELYKPVQIFSDSHPVVKDKFLLKFEVSIVDTGFTEKFFNYISQGNKGSFYGSTDGTKRLKDIIEKYDFSNAEACFKLIDEITENLEKDQRDGKNADMNIKDQLKKGVKIIDFYNFLHSLEFLKPKYELKLGNKDLQQLSPGEKGLLLLIFYLLVDKDDIPLIIDQPEENLDNQSVYELLVPCIREAKKNRQIIIVTHNPNLAVVCDAEQIIYSHLDKSNLNTVSYISGAIENPEINKKIIDVLEGTKPAFENRDKKYSLTLARVNE